MHTLFGRYVKDIATSTSLLIFSLSAAVGAQEIEEVTVTATKRAESIQDVAIAVTAFSGDELADSGIDSLEDLQYMLPNISFGNDFNFAKLSVRGLGLNTVFPGIDPSVSLHVDGAVVSRSSAYFASLFDVERVEVLRGPQGTLYGRNNTGGTVNIITAKPTEELEGYGRVTVGGDDLNIITEGAISGPLTDRLLGRAAIRFQDREGYGVNETTGNDIDDAEQFSARGSFQYLLNDRADFLVTGEYYRADDAGFALKFLAPSFPGQPPGFASLAVGGTATQDIRNIRSAPGLDPINDKETWAITGTLNWEISDNLTFRSITNYRDLFARLRQDFSMSDNPVHTPLPLAPGQTSGVQKQDVIQEQFSEELQLLYDSDFIHAIFGFFFFNEDVEADNKLGTDPVTDPANNRVVLDGFLDVKAYALFANVTFQLTDQIALKVAGRYSYEQRDLLTLFAVAPPGAPAAIPDPPVFREQSWGDFSPEFGLEWQPSDNLLAYVNYSQGFKSGNAEIGARGANFVDPEEIENFEVGLKSSFLDNSLQFNLAAFYYELEDGQFNRTIPITAPPFFISFLENAAQQEANGIEVEVQWLPTDRLQLDFAASYLDAEFTRFVTLNPIDPLLPTTPAANRAALLTGDIAGNVPRNSPQWQFNAHVGYEHPLNNGAVVSFGGNLAFKDDQFYSEFNDPRVAQDAYTIVDANIGYTSADDRWSVQGWVRNIADEEVIAGAFPVSTSRTIGGTFLPPRTYGVTLEYNF